MSEKFLNPYNFVPLGKPARTESGEKIAKGEHASVRHDAWQPDALHGQLRCSLVVETPLVIGGEYDRHDEKQSTPTIQAPYRRRMANGGAS